MDIVSPGDLLWIAVICCVPVPEFRVGLVFSAFAATIEIRMFFTGSQGWNSTILGLFIGSIPSFITK